MCRLLLLLCSGHYFRNYAPPHNNKMAISIVCFYSIEWKWVIEMRFKKDKRTNNKNRQTKRKYINEIYICKCVSDYWTHRFCNKKYILNKNYVTYVCVFVCRVLIFCNFIPNGFTLGDYFTNSAQIFKYRLLDRACIYIIYICIQHSSLCNVVPELFTFFVSIFETERKSIGDRSVCVSVREREAGVDNANKWHCRTGWLI